ncbi:MAG: hypothetical protein O2888_04115 [Chloroflexi bacterium]|nr:hypothetical protein [Chloroflexota bacterium]
MPARVDPVWRERVRVTVANEPSLPAAKIAGRLAQMGEDGAPGERTIGRWKQEFLESDEEERRPYRYLQWPQSMGTPDLPWAASRVVLELLGDWREYSGLVGPRPTVRLARWAWRVYQAAPDAPAIVRLNLALDLAVSEVLGSPRPDIEWRLVCRPWAGELEAAAYAEAVASGSIPEYAPGEWPIDPRQLSGARLKEALMATGVVDEDEVEETARNVMTADEELIDADGGGSPATQEDRDGETG